MHVEVFPLSYLSFRSAARKFSRGHKVFYATEPIRDPAAKYATILAGLKTKVALLANSRSSSLPLDFQSTAAYRRLRIPAFTFALKDAVHGFSRGSLAAHRFIGYYRSTYK
jgi:hypothetical protein